MASAICTDLPNVLGASHDKWKVLEYVLWNIVAAAIKTHCNRFQLCVCLNIYRTPCHIGHRLKVLLWIVTATQSCKTTIHKAFSSFISIIYFCSLRHYMKFEKVLFHTNRYKSAGLYWLTAMFQTPRNKSRNILSLQDIKVGKNVDNTKLAILKCSFWFVTETDGASRSIKWPEEKTFIAIPNMVYNKDQGLSV